MKPHKVWGETFGYQKRYRLGVLRLYEELKERSNWIYGKKNQTEMRIGKKARSITEADVRQMMVLHPNQCSTFGAGDTHWWNAF